MISKDKPAQGYSREEIHLQLQRIFTDQAFAVSDILRRFLSFIVEETLDGRSNQIKEYTIGVNVLHKPCNFNPSQDAIVRIHAGRLRRALHHYYKEVGVADPIRIEMPKGSYLPVFSENEMETADLNLGMSQEHISDFHGNGNAEQFVVTGEMQYAEDRLRIRVQMINSETHEEMWSQVVEYNLTTTNGFDIQEGIVKKLAAAVGDYYKFIKQRTAPPSENALP
jgi:TolB-like protein